MIDVGWLAPGDQWDQTMVRQLLSNELHHTGVEFRHHTGYPNLVDSGAIVVIPGRYWHEQAADISEALDRYRWVLAIKTGDEEDLLDTGDIVHPNLRWWVQTPREGRDHGDAFPFGVGWSPHFADLGGPPPDKTVSAFFSGQLTHERRHLCYRATRDIPGAERHETAGFTQGMDPADYTGHMVRAKVAPCPSGAVSPDSFRVWEALQAHTVPIVDTVSPVDGDTHYWDGLFNGGPFFPLISDYTDLVGYAGDQLEEWPGSANRVAAAWIRYKRHLTVRLLDDLNQLGAL